MLQRDKKEDARIREDRRLEKGERWKIAAAHHGFIGAAEIEWDASAEAIDWRIEENGHRSGRHGDLVVGIAISPERMGREQQPNRGDRKNDYLRPLQDCLACFRIHELNNQTIRAKQGCCSRANVASAFPA